MTSFDIVVLSIVLLSGLVGLARGFVREFLAVVAWAGAAVVAVFCLPLAQPLFDWVPDPDWAKGLTLGYVFAMAVGLFYLIARSISHSVQSSALGGIDLSLGLLFGLVRGAAPLCVAYLAVSTLQPVQQWPKQVLESRSLPFIHDATALVVRHIPAEYRPALPPSPPMRFEWEKFLRGEPIASPGSR